MTTSAGEIRRWILVAVRDESVALAADVDYVTWSSETAPRVFVGQSGFIGSRNRGRLPFIEVNTESQQFTDDTGDGGTVETKVTLRLHDTGRDPEAVQDRMHEILTAAISCIRDNRQSNFTQLGNDTIDAIQPGPMGWMMSAILSLEHSFDRDTYEQEP